MKINNLKKNQEGNMAPTTKDNAKKWIKNFLIGFLILILIFNSFYLIHSGQEGVLLTFGKANPKSIEPGLHFKIPLMQNIVKYDIRTQKYGVDDTKDSLESAASKDLQIVKVRLAVNYHLARGKAPAIYSELSTSNYGVEDTVILPTLHEATKASVAQFNAADLINKREAVRTEIENLLKTKLNQYNIVVEQVSITDFDFSEQFNQAIEAKVTAEQQKLKADNDLQRIRVEADQIRVRAEAQRDAAIAEAKGEAEKVKLVQEQLQRSPNYVDYIRATRWDGKYPTFYMTGDANAVPLLNIPIDSGNSK